MSKSYNNFVEALEEEKKTCKEIAVLLAELKNLNNAMLEEAKSALIIPLHR